MSPSGRPTPNPTARACSSIGRTPSPATSIRISAPPGAPRCSTSGSRDPASLESPRRCRCGLGEGVGARAAAADARPGDLRRSVLPGPAGHRVGRRTQARPLRGRAASLGRLPETRRMGQHLDGRGLGRHQCGAERDRAVRLCRALRLRRAMASACQRVVHVGDRHRRRGLLVLLVSPDGPSRPHLLGDAPGAPLQPVLQPGDCGAGRSGTSAATSSCALCCRCSAYRPGWCSPASPST